MAAITVRNLSDETHRALKARALNHGRSTEAEVRAILNDSVLDTRTRGLGTRIARASAEVGGFELDLPARADARQPLDLS